MALYTVLTGDLIQSSRLSSDLRRELLGWLKKLAEDFSILHGDILVGSLDVYRGDSWQLCLKGCSKAVLAAVFMRAGLKAHISGENVDTRVGIGVGTVDFISEKRISESSGPAFLHSGRCLDGLSANLSFCLNWPEGSAAVDVINKMSLPLLDRMIRQWSHPESVAVFGAMMGWTQEETRRHALARKSDGTAPSQQAIGRALHRISWSGTVEPVLAASMDLLGRQEYNLKRL